MKLPPNNSPNLKHSVKYSGLNSSKSQCHLKKKKKRWDGWVRNSSRLRKQNDSNMQGLDLEFGFKNKSTPKNDIPEAIREIPVLTMCYILRDYCYFFK